jgi:hypothetical protein
MSMELPRRKFLAQVCDVLAYIVPMCVAIINNLKRRILGKMRIKFSLHFGVRQKRIVVCVVVLLNEAVRKLVTLGTEGRNGSFELPEALNTGVFVWLIGDRLGISGGCGGVVWLVVAGEFEGIKTRLEVIAFVADTLGVGLGEG